MERKLKPTELFYPILVLTLAIAPWVIFIFFPDYLDSKYKEIGFCHSTKTRQGFDSFEICFWVDLLGSLILYLLVTLLKDGIPSTDVSEIVSSVPSTIMHGLVHYYQYFNQGKFVISGMDPMKPIREGPWYIFIGNFAFIFSFQYNLQNSVGNFKSIMGISLVIKAFQTLFVPQIWSLAYVNTWIFLTDIFVKYFKPSTRKPDWGDTILKIMIVILLLEPIFEATKCENGLENYGGHALFDSWIVLYEFIWLGIVYYRNRGIEKSKNE